MRKVSSIEELTEIKPNEKISFVCERCGQSFSYFADCIKRKNALLCKCCSMVMHRDCKAISKKAGATRLERNKSLTDKEHYEQYVLPQISRTKESKQKSIEKYLDTISKASKEKRDLMRQRQSAKKASMTEEAKQQRCKKYLESRYKDKWPLIRERATKTMLELGYKFKETNNLLFECECHEGHKFTYSPIKRYECFGGIVPHCPVCFNGKLTHRSHYEDLICKMLDDMSIEYCKNDRKVLDGKEIDILIKSKSIAIEFDGLYWHQNSKKSLEKQKLLEQKGIRLIDIFEGEFHYDKVKSILEAALHKSKLVYARECKVVEVPSSEYEDFCERNHIQRYAPASIRLGLTYSGQLMQVMSFSKPRFNKKYDYEIIRECTKCGYGIVGGKERLWKAFLRTKKPKSVLSYCDKRYFTGTSYLSLGMKQLEDSSSSYVYVNANGEVLSRYQCQKHKLQRLLRKFDAALTETENMEMNGYYKMYDFGQHIFEWKEDTN